MIGTIDIEVNAANPQIPLKGIYAYISSPSRIALRNVPRRIGNWAITAVRVNINNPDNASATVAAVLTGGVWVATLPASAAAGTAVNGYQVLADGTDENGAEVTGYVLGVGAVNILTRDATVVVDGVTYYAHLTDTESDSPNKGDIAIDTMRMWNGTAWVAFGASVDWANVANKPDLDARALAHWKGYTIQGKNFDVGGDWNWELGLRIVAGGYLWRYRTITDTGVLCTVQEGIATSLPVTIDGVVIVSETENGVHVCDDAQIDVDIPASALTKDAYDPSTAINADYLGRLPSSQYALIKNTIPAAGGSTKFVWADDTLEMFYNGTLRGWIYPYSLGITTTAGTQFVINEFGAGFAAEDADDSDPRKLNMAPDEITKDGVEYTRVKLTELCESLPSSSSVAKMTIAERTSLLASIVAILKGE